MRTLLGRSFPEMAKPFATKLHNPERRQVRTLRALLRKRPVRALVILGIIALAVWLVTSIITSALNASNVTTTGSRPQVGAPEQSPAPNAFKQTYDAFGPWTMGNPSLGSDTKPPILMLRNAGGVDASSWTVMIDQSWQLTQPFEILDVGVVGQQVEILTSNRKTYRIAPNHPFIIEAVPTKLYAVTLAGNGKVTIITQSTEWAKAHGHKK